MALRESKKQATTRRIKVAARELFLEHGFEATTMDQVAMAADVSRASLFNYFPGKAALLEALGEDLESRLLQAVGHYREKHPAAPDVVEHLFSHAARVLEQTTGLTRMLFMQSSGGGGFPALLEAFVGLVADGQSQGRWRNDIAVETLAELLYLEFVAGLLDWCGRGPRGAQFRRRAEGLNLLLAG
jgi:AcrR family transcriptional regulator